jgi:hypothetical protein
MQLPEEHDKQVFFISERKVRQIEHLKINALSWDLQNLRSCLACKSRQDWPSVTIRSHLKPSSRLGSLVSTLPTIGGHHREKDITIWPTEPYSFTVPLFSACTVFTSQLPGYCGPSNCQNCRLLIHFSKGYKLRVRKMHKNSSKNMLGMKYV